MKGKIRYLVPRDGVLYIKVPIGRYPNGITRHKEQRVHSEAEAIQEIARILKEYGGVGNSAVDGERMTFDLLMREYKKVYPNKKKCYTKPLEEYFAGRRIRTITYVDCLNFKLSREKVKNQNYKKQPAPPRKPATIHRELETLRSVLLFALEPGWITRNPFKRTRGNPPLIDKKKEKRRTRFPTPEEESMLLAVCVRPREHLRGLIIASLDTGLRRGAIHELTWNCVDFDTGLLQIPEGNRYKNRPEWVGMTDRLETVLRDLYENSDKKPDSLVFGRMKEIKHPWKTACRLAGIQGLRFNDLRHGFSTSLMEAGVPKPLAMKAAGHSNESIHNIYTNVDQRIALELAEALNKLHESRIGSKFGSGLQESSLIH